MMFSTRASDSGKTTKHKSGRAAACGLAISAASVGLVMSAAPASAHLDHSAAYSYGSHDDCLGASSLAKGKYDDFWYGHLATTSVHVVPGNSCIRGTTTTWSDNYWTGFTNNVYIELYDYWGQLRWRSSDHRQLKFSVGPSSSSNHAKKDFYTFKLPSGLANDVRLIKITQLEGCCL